jgi:hypothetical protein
VPLVANETDPKSTESDDTDNLQIAASLMMDNALLSTILAITTKGNPTAIKKWKKWTKLSKFVEDKTKLYPPFGVFIKSKLDPMIQVESDMPEVINLLYFMTSS